MIVNYYGPGEARFRGAYVLPERRGKGIGLAVMKEALNLAKRLGQKRIMIYTFSYLDCLAPGALLYLRSGGRIGSRVYTTDDDLTKGSSWFCSNCQIAWFAECHLSAWFRHILTVG